MTFSVKCGTYSNCNCVLWDGLRLARNLATFTSQSRDYRRVPVPSCPACSFDVYYLWNKVAWECRSYAHTNWIISSMFSNVYIKQHSQKILRHALTVPFFVSCFISFFLRFHTPFCLCTSSFCFYLILSFLPTNFSKNSECHWVHAHYGCIFKSIYVYNTFPGCMYVHHIHSIATHGSQKTLCALKPALQ